MTQKIKKMRTKPRKSSKIFIINGIKNLLRRNYKIEPDVIDIESEVDLTLTFQENWNHIKRKFVKPVAKDAKRY